MNNQADRDLDEYLQGESDISQLYQSSMNQEPPAHLDQFILRAATSAASKTQRTTASVVENPKQGFLSRLFSDNGWLVPTASLASFAVIAVVVAVLISKPNPIIDDTNIAHAHAPTTSGMQTVNSTTVKTKHAASITGESKKGSLSAEMWISNIKVLHEQGDIVKAKQSLALFQTQFPKYPEDKLKHALKDTGLTK